MAIDFVIVRGMHYEPQLWIVNSYSPIQALGERLDNRLQFARRIRQPSAGRVRSARHLSSLVRLLADDLARWTAGTVRVALCCVASQGALQRPAQHN
jgi:hypothetical protein